jgi:hypothetical protein
MLFILFAISVFLLRRFRVWLRLAGLARAGDVNWRASG